jgi:hypothetical protein
LKILIQTNDNDRKYINFDAESKWCQKSLNTDFYDTGFELRNTSPEILKRIESIIEELGFVD